MRHCLVEHEAVIYHQLQEAPAQVEKLTPMNGARTLAPALVC